MVQPQTPAKAAQRVELLTRDRRVIGNWLPAGRHAALADALNSRARAIVVAPALLEGLEDGRVAIAPRAAIGRAEISLAVPARKSYGLLQAGPVRGMAALHATAPTRVRIGIGSFSVLGEVVLTGGDLDLLARSAPVSALSLREYFPVLDARLSVPGRQERDRPLVLVNRDRVTAIAALGSVSTGSRASRT